MASLTASVFISHSWAYSGHYDTLSEWLFRSNWTVGQDRLVFLDTSVPKHDPIHGARNTSDLRQAIYQRISASNVVVIPTGMYATYSKWIGEEIKGAQKYAKPIVAVNPWGQERKASIVANAANELVGWRKASVGAAAWRWAKG